MKLKIKKIIASILVLTTLTGIAFGANGNVDSGGSGGTSSGGSKDYCWYSGDYGVRVSIINAETRATVRTPIDLSNKSRKDIKYHFGKGNKIQYVQQGKALKLYEGGYKWTIPAKKMPVIMSASGNNITAIKKYFTSKNTIEMIAKKCNIDYKELTESGKYKMLLEPIMYVTFKRQRWAMTATETAKYNKQTNNSVRRKMVSITHKRLPYSMFLEYSDLGFPAYNGATSKPANDDLILRELGLGIVRFAPIEEPVDPPIPDIDVDKCDYEYRTDTDVITSITVSTGTRITPDAPVTVHFNILGKTYSKGGIVMPDGGSQLVWVKWHTPKTPQKVTITATASGGNVSKTTIKANIVELKEHTPPDPLAKDRNDKFKLVNLPQKPNILSSSWYVWYAWWEEDWQYVYAGTDSEGNAHYEYVDLGDWEYATNTYSADLSASMKIKPSIRTPKTYTEKNGSYEMKSGYGLHNNVKTQVTYNCSSSDVTPAQNSISIFSDFKYEKYDRVLEKKSGGGYNTEFEFKKNKYSTYNDRTHFTPIWYPDEKNYIVNSEIIDVWTPTGMLRANVNDKIMINGNLHQDRHIAIMK